MTSSVVRLFPLWKVTPLRSSKVQVMPSLLASQPVARAGTGWFFSSIQTNQSYICATAAISFTLVWKAGSRVVGGCQPRIRIPPFLGLEAAGCPPAAVAAGAAAGAALVGWAATTGAAVAAGAGGLPAQAASVLAVAPDTPSARSVWMNCRRLTWPVRKRWLKYLTVSSVLTSISPHRVGGIGTRKTNNARIPRTLAPIRDIAVYPYGCLLIHISEPTRLGMISYAVFCLKKK